MPSQGLLRPLSSRVVGVVAVCGLIVAACAPAPQPAGQPAASPAQPAAPAAAAAPAKPAAQPAKPAAQPAKAATAASEEPDAALVDAAKKEGRVVWYNGLELTLGKKLADMFEAKYGVKVEVVRNGSEIIFSQFMKEQAANVKKADLVSTGETGHFLTMRSAGHLVAYRPKAVDAFAPQLKSTTMDADNYWFSFRLSPWAIVYNTNRVKAGDVPQSYKELVDPKWKGRLIHGHPGFAGAVVLSMHVLTPLLGPDYYKQLAKNEPLIVQSTVDLANKVVGGERDVGAGALVYNAFPAMQKGNPIKIVYPQEGSPLGVYPQAVAKTAPHPNAARLFQEYIFSREAQQFLVSEGGLHSARGDVTLPEGQADLSKLKLLFADPAALEAAREGIQKMFKDAFGV